MTQQQVWPGPAAEYGKLRAAADHNCQCHDNDVCTAHRMLSDQDALNHLAFAATLRYRYIRSEWRKGPRSEAA
jgi:hypothetical protein